MNQKVTGAPRVTLHDQVGCLREEMRRRREVYPALVRAGKMTQQAADWQQVAMARAYKTLRALASIDALVGVRVEGLASRPDVPRPG